MLLGALSGLPAFAIVIIMKLFIIFQLDRYDIITSSIIEAVLNSSCVGYKKCTMASWWNCEDGSQSEIFKVHKSIVQTCLLLVRIDPVDKNVSQILSASQSPCTFKMCQILYFLPPGIFSQSMPSTCRLMLSRKMFCKYFPPPFPHSCTFKMCQMSDLAYLQLLCKLHTYHS